MDDNYYNNCTSFGSFPATTCPFVENFITFLVHLFTEGINENTMKDIYCIFATLFPPCLENKYYMTPLLYLMTTILTIEICRRIKNYIQNPTSIPSLLVFQVTMTALWIFSSPEITYHPFVYPFHKANLFFFSVLATSAIVVQSCCFIAKKINRAVRRGIGGQQQQQITSPDYIPLLRTLLIASILLIIHFPTQDRNDPLAVWIKYCEEFRSWLEAAKTCISYLATGGKLAGGVFVSNIVDFGLPSDFFECFGSHHSPPILQCIEPVMKGLLGDDYPNLEIFAILLSLIIWVSFVVIISIMILLHRQRMKKKIQAIKRLDYCGREWLKYNNLADDIIAYHNDHHKKPPDHVIINPYKMDNNDKRTKAIVYKYFWRLKGRESYLRFKAGYRPEDFVSFNYTAKDGNPIVMTGSSSASGGGGGGEAATGQRHRPQYYDDASRHGRERALLEACALKMSNEDRLSLLGKQYHQNDDLYRLIRQSPQHYFAVERLTIPTHFHLVRSFKCWKTFLNGWYLTGQDISTQRWYDVTPTGHLKAVETIFRIIIDDPNLFCNMVGVVGGSSSKQEEEGSRKDGDDDSGAGTRGRRAAAGASAATTIDAASEKRLAFLRVTWWVYLVANTCIWCCMLGWRIVLLHNSNANESSTQL